MTFLRCTIAPLGAAVLAIPESTIQLLLANRQQESLTNYTDGLRAYEPLEKDDAFNCEYVVQGDGK